ncbi:MAG: HDIG domain-containing protein [Patescibacteria group bacterium]|nr:HDIG domain-containing protein [Patescibacteria group bacterium]
MVTENLREKSLLLIDQYIKNENLKKHLLATEALMRSLAKKFNQDEEIWGITGLLHDLDWEITKETPEKHPFIAVEILEKEGFPEEIIEAIRKHNHIHNLIPETLLEKALYSCEEITGLIVAVALVMPNKKLAEVTVDKIMSKFKEYSFARGVNREIIMKCEEFLGIKVEELAEICLKSMQSISDQLSL